jgi:hypothetical protein
VPPPPGGGGAAAESEKATANKGGSVVRNMSNGMQSAERALNQMPDDGGQIVGTTPEINHGE